VYPKDSDMRISSIQRYTPEPGGDTNISIKPYADSNFNAPISAASLHPFSSRPLHSLYRDEYDMEGDFILKSPRPSRPSESLSRDVNERRQGQAVDDYRRKRPMQECHDLDDSKRWENKMRITDREMQSSNRYVYFIHSRNNKKIIIKKISKRENKK